MALKPGRIRCEVIGCRRTGDASKYKPNTILICGKCWRLGGKRDRRIFRRCEKLQEQGKLKTRGGVNIAYIKRRVWDRILKAATERTVGIRA